jgi:hypothetical protein
MKEVVITALQARKYRSRDKHTGNIKKGKSVDDDDDSVPVAGGVRVLKTPKKKNQPRKKNGTFVYHYDHLTPIII